jgi:hypothetical protein
MKKVEMTDEMRSWSEQKACGFIFDGKTEYSVDVKRSVLVGRDAEACFQKLYPEAQWVDKPGYDFLLKGHRVEIKGSYVSGDYTQRPLYELRCSITPYGMDRLDGCDWIVWFYILKDRTVGWCVGYMKRVAFMECNKTELNPGDKMVMSGKPAPFKLYEIPASFTRELP